MVSILCYPTMAYSAYEKINTRELYAQFLHNHSNTSINYDTFPCSVLTEPIPHALRTTDGKTTMFCHMIYDQLVMIITTHYFKFKATLNSNTRNGI